MAPDKLMHLVVGILMGCVAGLFNYIGFFLGWAIIIGWEVGQAITGSGTPELMDIVYGGVGFTVLWLLVRFLRSRYS